jgi:hypothetical protein
VYTVLRLLAFLVPFGLLMLLPIMQQYYWLAAIFAALIGLSLSMLFRDVRWTTSPPGSPSDAPGRGTPSATRKPKTPRATASARRLPIEPRRLRHPLSRSVLCGSSAHSRDLGRRGEPTCLI